MLGPRLGEVARSRDIGKASDDHSRKYVWHACVSCGEERWVVLLRGEPQSLRCQPCGQKHRTRPSNVGSEWGTTRPARCTPALTDLHWAAGYCEGEGYFGWTGTTQRVTVDSVDPEPTERLLHLFGGAIYEIPPRKPTWSPKQNWAINGSRARGLMMTLYPLLSNRRREAIRRALRPEKHS